MADKQFDKGRFDFIGKAKFLVPFWMVVMCLGTLEMFRSGLDYGIDFVGGTEIQVQFAKPVNVDEIRKLVTGLGYEKASVQSFGGDSEYLIRTEAIQAGSEKEMNELQNTMVAKITQGLQQTFSENKAEVRRIDSVGPQVGNELKRNSLLAAFYSLFMILIYIGMRFDYKYAPSAVICLFHDVLITMAIFSIFDREVNVQTLAAVLTLIGYSLNDTIINFDRIRENEKLYRDVPFADVVNRSVNDMLSRTLLTVGTTEIAVLALYFLADGVIQQIAFTLGIGILLGTFSSIYIAAPLVIYLDRFEHSREARAKMRAAKA